MTGWFAQAGSPESVRRDIGRLPRCATGPRDASRRVLNHVQARGDEVKSRQRPLRSEHWRVLSHRHLRPKMRSTEYEPVPTDTQPPPPPPQKTRSRLVTLRRILLFSVTIVVVSFAAYKSGQWSAEKVLLNPGTELSSGNSEGEIIADPTNTTLAPTPTQSSNGTEMSSGGKFSVG